MERRVFAGRYELVRALGRGGTGVVWLAKDVNTGADVAVKVASAEISAHTATRERFLREAKLATSLSSPHVARIHDHGLTEEGDLFVAGEYLEGASLSEELGAAGRLSLRETSHVVSGVCAGLACAHQAGIVHRDITPQNVFLERAADDGTLGRVKILDFGCAKAADWLAEPTADATRTGDLVGTPCYMSPEQAKGLTSIDFRADLWAVGVVAFECMTGVRPFEARALGPLVRMILQGPLPVPSRVAPEAAIPPEVDAWMASVLVRDARGRPPSAHALASSLATAVEHRNLDAPKAPAASADSAVRERLLAGDVSGAAGAAIEQLGPEMLGFFSARLAEKTLVDDAFALFCEKLLSGLPAFRWESSLRTWAYRLAWGSTADVIRAEGKHRSRTEPLTDSRVTAIADQVRTGTWPLLRTERRTAALQLIEELPEEDRTLLVLRVNRAMPWLDIARVLLDKESPDSNELHRAAATLRKRFRPIRERLQKRARELGVTLDDSDED